MVVPLWIAVATGIAIGVIYTLSPMAVLAGLALVPLVRYAARDTGGGERRWLLAVLIVAIAARVAVVVGLFIVTDHTRVPFGTLFGDEEYFLRRSIWLRNFALGIPIHHADFVYAFDARGRTAYSPFLALLQVLVGPAPYGAHLVSILCFISASVLLYRLARASFGRLPALAGLTVLLFLPSLFAWSIAVLKEPLYMLVLCLGLASAVAAGRERAWPRRIGALALVIGSALAAQSLRDGGLLMAGFGGMAGWGAGRAASRPRVAVIGILVAVLAAAIMFTRGAVQDRIVFGVRHVASVHWENVNTAGRVYTILDPDFYVSRDNPDRMGLRQGVRYVVGAFVAYVAVPTPWTAQSRAALAYVPEQIVWYVMLLLVPFGLASAVRRDRLLAALFAAYAAAAAFIVALTSGNVGTLVRHRGLAVPFLIWFSVLGACELAGGSVALREEFHADDR